MLVRGLVNISSILYHPNTAHAIRAFRQLLDSGWFVVGLKPLAQSACNAWSFVGFTNDGRTHFQFFKDRRVFAGSFAKGWDLAIVLNSEHGCVNFVCVVLACLSKLENGWYGAHKMIQSVEKITAMMAMVIATGCHGSA